MSNLVYITSMFRSGTTLIARMLNVHPQLVCASDPMRPLVNSFRFDMADEDYRSRHSRFDPLDDYFINDTDLLARMLEADLELDVGCDNRELLDAVKKRAVAFSGLYSDALDTATSVHTYADAVRYLLHVVQECYADGRDYKQTAFKEVWSTEFYPALRRSFPDTKCMVIVRDPRSVVASKVAMGEPYPCAFMGRQWRKLTMLAAYMKYAFPEDVLLFRYEDFVQEPEKYTRSMCELAGVPFDKKLLDGSLYRDGRNESWKQNTSYSGAGSKKINAGTMDKWKILLPEEEVASIELYTYDWMKEFGYEPQHDLADLLNLDAGRYRRYQAPELAEWIRKHSFDDDLSRIEHEIMIEKLRLTKSSGLPTGDPMALHNAWW